MDIDKNNLLNESSLAEVKALAEEYIAFDMFREAFSLSKELSKAINANNDLKIKYPELYNEYLKIITKLKWVGLPIMREEDLVNLFQNSFARIFSIPNYNVWEKLKTVLISIVVLEDRDKLKSEIRNALINNQERITKNKIKINNEEKEPTVGNWLLDYTRNLGTGIVDKFKLTQYLVNGENIKKLDENEKHRVKVLFKLYEKLKLSSLTLEGVEEDIPIDEEYGKGLIVGGNPQFFKETKEEKELFDIASRVIAERERMDAEKNNLKIELKKYVPDSLEYRAIEEEIKKLANVK
ncbi:MAG: hypothetical protein UT48_C0049G0005 [Parcubacteria group bacterium GW2011_GWE2_39_37]|nr:MAG: hypothetical protein UT48_C0049G0005 [Parcubacteria group bacterium GW2011_GWE2_39_37]